jgi:hypothetical protein
MSAENVLKFFKSKIFLVSVAIFIGSVIFLWDSLVSTALSFYFKNYFKTEFGADVTVAKVRHKKNTWMLHSPVVTFSGGALNAKQVSIGYTPYFWDRRVEVKIKVSDPLFELNDQTLALLDGFKKMDFEKGWIDYHVFVEVENGSAIAEHLPPLFFHLHEELGPRSQCTFRGGFSPSNLVEGFYLCKEGEHSQAVFKFNDLDLAAASKWMEHLQPGGLEWIIEGGRVNGTWTVSPAFHLGTGDVKVSELTLTSVDNPFTIHIPSLSTVKVDDGTTILLESKGKLNVKVDEDVLIDLYHFGGELFLDKQGFLSGSMEGVASLSPAHPNLQVLFEVDQPNSTDLFRYKINGPLQALTSQLPCRYEHVIENDFAGAEAALEGSCVAIEKGVEFCTCVKLERDGELVLDDFNIYCRVDPTTSKFIDEGNFIAPNLNLKTVVSPFLFLDKQFELSGTAFFEGTWNPSLLHVRYRPNGATLESEALLMEVPPAPEQPDDEGQFFPGEHFFDFDRNHQYGRLYVNNGFYLEKRTDLLFSELNTQIVFEGKTLTATQIQTCCQGVNFQGTIGLDYASPLKKTFDLDILIEKMEGKVSQFQDMLTHFPQRLFLHRMPIEGKIMNGRGDNKIALHFITGKCNVEVDIKGILVEGKTEMESPIRAEDISFEFAYNHENKTLGLTHLGGLLKVGTPATEKVFRIQGEGVQFKNYLKKEGDFSIALRDDRQEWIKLAGAIEPVGSRQKGDQVRIVVDSSRSHLKEGQPIHCTCEVSDWDDLDELDLSFQLQVPGIVKELQQGVECGLVKLPEPFVEQLNEWIEEDNTKGQLLVQVGYDRSTSLVTMQARGKQIQLGKHHYDQVNLEAKKRHHTWMIEQLQFDDFSISADLQKAEQDWKLNFLGIQWGGALLAGLEGTLDPNLRQLNARVNLFELDLAKAMEYPRFKDVLADQSVTGELKGVGECRLCLTDEAPGWSCDVLGNLNSHAVSYQGIELNDSTNVSFHLLSDKTIALRNFKTKALGVDWLVEKCCYSPKVGQLELENVLFSYPVSDGHIWMTALQTRFPDLMDASLQKTIGGLKTEGEMEGSFDLALTENIHKFTLRLKDGDYSWKGESRAVQNFSLTSIPTEKSFLFQTAWQNANPWVNVKTGNGEKGVLILSEESPKSEEPSQTLVAEWKNPSDRPLTVEKISGNAFGIGADLQKRGDDYSGYLTLQLPALAPMLTREHLLAVQKAQLKGAYQFEGEWHIPFDEQDWLKKAAFTGTLKGSGCAFKGYCFDHIEGICNLTPGRFLLHECHMEDAAFRGELKELLITYEDDDAVPAKFHVNLLQLNDVRPILVKKDGNDEPLTKKNLIFNQVQLTECFGDVGNPQSYLGKGFLQFSTPTKRGIESTPFALPAEILSRLGLNSAIMTPVRGTAIFDIADGRCYIPKLKDVYSQGKLSKFYIYHSKEPSYVDFDGNVHVQVRIKHYNLLFKLSEMLTINIRGTVQKPLYYLQK